MHIYRHTHSLSLSVFLFFWYPWSRLHFTIFFVVIICQRHKMNFVWYTLIHSRARMHASVRFIWSIVESKCFFIDVFFCCSFYFKSWICYALLSACVCMYIRLMCVVYLYANVCMSFCKKKFIDICLSHISIHHTESDVWRSSLFMCVARISTQREKNTRKIERKEKKPNKRLNFWKERKKNVWY